MYIVSTSIPRLACERVGEFTSWPVHLRKSCDRLFSQANPAGMNLFQCFRFRWPMLQPQVSINTKLRTAKYQITERSIVYSITLVAHHVDYICHNKYINMPQFPAFATLTPTSGWLPSISGLKRSCTQLCDILVEFVQFANHSVSARKHLCSLDMGRCKSGKYYTVLATACVGSVCKTTERADYWTLAQRGDVSGKLHSSDS